MKTNVNMKRDFNGIEITQRTFDKFFNATDLLIAYNATSQKKKVIAEFWSNKGTKEFMKALVKDLNSNVGKNLYCEKDLFSTSRGTHGGTFMNEYLFIKFAMWLSPEFEVQVIKWVYDNLIDFRNQAGDHYTEMCKAIQKGYYDYYNQKPDPLIFIKEAKYLNLLVFEDEKGKQRNEATEIQLDKLNRLQLANIKLIQSGISKDVRKQKLSEFAALI